MKLNEKNESNDFSPRYGYNGIEDRHSNKSLNTFTATLSPVAKRYKQLKVS